MRLLNAMLLTIFILVNISATDEDIKSFIDKPCNPLPLDRDNWVHVWYGNLDQSPIETEINARMPIDVYIETSDSAYAADIALVLGLNDLYFDSLLSESEGQVFYPITEWQSIFFYWPQGSPPNPEGWSSESFIGFAWLGGPRPPWLHFETPQLGLRFMVKSANDSLLIGRTVEALAPGLNEIWGHSYCGDTLGGPGYPVTEYFSPVYFSEEVKVERSELPRNDRLFQNYPNPFNTRTVIEYALPEPAHVSLNIYNIEGKLIATLVDISQPAGYHSVTWSVDNTPSGIYFCRIAAGDFSQTGKMILLK